MDLATIGFRAYKALPMIPTDGTLQTAALPSLSYISGFTPNAAGDGFIVPRTGRYRVTTLAIVQQHPTAWLAALAVTTAGAPAMHAIPPVAVVDINALYNGVDLGATDTVELVAGTVIQFQFQVTGGPSAVLPVLIAQYVGPATGP